MRDALIGNASGRTREHTTIAIPRNDGAPGALAHEPHAGLGALSPWTCQPGHGSHTEPDNLGTTNAAKLKAMPSVTTSHRALRRNTQAR